LAENDGQRDGEAASSSGDPGPLSRLLQELADASSGDMLEDWKSELTPGSGMGRGVNGYPSVPPVIAPAFLLGDYAKSSFLPARSLDRLGRRDEVLVDAKALRARMAPGLSPW
jgi:hypothetical protein